MSLESSSSTSETVYLEVLATDVLIFESGAPSTESQWTFYMEVPRQWALAPDLNQRVFGIALSIYVGFTERTASSGAGERYQLRAISAVILDAAQEAERPWAERGKTLYLLQPDGTARAR